MFLHTIYGNHSSFRSCNLHSTTVIRRSPRRFLKWVYTLEQAITLHAHTDWQLNFRVYFPIHLRIIRAEFPLENVGIFAGRNHHFVLYYLPALVHTKTTIHLSVGGQCWTLNSLLCNSFTNRFIVLFFFCYKPHQNENEITPIKNYAPKARWILSNNCLIRQHSPSLRRVIVLL